jgi:hypothetical protein
VYLEGECAAPEEKPVHSPRPAPRCSGFHWYHPAFTAVDPQGELRGGILTGMVNLYPNRDVFRSAEPFEVAVAANGHGVCVSGAAEDFYACALFAPDAVACVKGVLAVDPRHRKG